MMFDIVTAGIFLWRARAIFTRGSFVIGMQDENVIEKWRKFIRNWCPRHSDECQLLCRCTIHYTGICLCHTGIHRQHYRRWVNIHLRPNQYPSIRQINFRFQLTNIYSMCATDCVLSAHDSTRAGKLENCDCDFAPKWRLLQTVCVPTVSTFRTVFLTLSTHFGRYAVPFRLTMQQLNE